jgi:hypothetical protein
MRTVHDHQASKKMSQFRLLDNNAATHLNPAFF